MEITVKEQQKLVTVWLTCEEQQDAALQEYLAQLCCKYKEQKYLVAVYLSGKQDLYSATSNLLCYNRKQLPNIR